MEVEVEEGEDLVEEGGAHAPLSAVSLTSRDTTLPTAVAAYRVNGPP